MRYREMGATGIRVSEVGFGSGDNAGLLVKGEPQEQIRAVERALELGVNYFDTSPDYGKGLAETNIGKAMREIGFRPVLATKVEVMPDELDHIADAVVESVEDSLRRLQVDCVDVLQIHNPPSIETDTTVPGWLHLGLSDYLGPGGALEGMERVRRAGKARFFGFANEDADADAVLALLETGEFHMLNVWYDLLNPTAGLPTPDGLDVQHDYGQFLRRARELSVGAAAIRPLAGGVLTDHAVGGGGRHALAGAGCRGTRKCIRRWWSARVRSRSCRVRGRRCRRRRTALFCRMRRLRPCWAAFRRWRTWRRRLGAPARRRFRTRIWRASIWRGAPTWANGTRKSSSYRGSKALALGCVKPRGASEGSGRWISGSA